MALITKLVKFPMSSSSNTIKSIMFFFKTSGKNSGDTANISLFTIKANGKFYKIRINPVTGKDDTNKLSVFVGASEINVYEQTEAKKTVNLYQNKVLAPLNDFQFKRDQWTFIIMEFLNPVASTDSYFQVNSGTGLATNISNFSYYCLNTAEQVQYVTYNTWDDINNANWYNYTSNSSTWQDVYSTKTNSRPVGSVTDIWSSFFGVSAITQVNNSTVAETIDDIIPLQLGNYEYKTYQDIVKTSKLQSPV
jgi:hypothetical protein